MNNTDFSVAKRCISLWAEFIQHSRFGIIIAVFILTVFSTLYIKTHLGISTNTADMLSRELPWRQLDIEYEKQFPQSLDNLLVVIEAETPDQAKDSAKKLNQAITENPKYITDIYYPSSLPYFRRSAFLFLNVEELQDLANRLASIQPFLGILLNDKNLHGLFTMLGDAIEAKQDGENIDLKPLLGEINKVFDQADYRVSWERLMSAEETIKPVYREFIVLQTEEAKEEFLSGEFAVKHVRSIIDASGLTKNASIRIRLTGGTALSYEELKSVSDANLHAIIASFILVALILTFGLGSFRLVTACLITLFAGLIITTAFATATVGELNLISVAFAVLYIGLGIDFAIHLTLRYREQQLLDDENAIQNSLSRVYRSLFLCAITTAIGFYSLMPTDYVGVAELGWIAGGGMFISLALTLSLLPAILSFNSNSAKNRNRKETNNIILSKLAMLPYRYSKQILIITLLIVVALLTQINRINFDTNTLNLQSPDNESVQTYRDLLNDTDNSPWNSILLKPNRDEVEIARQRIKKLDLIDEIIWIGDLLPDEQDEKLFIIDEMNLFMGLLNSNNPVNSITNTEKINSMSEFASTLKQSKDEKLNYEISTLKRHLKQYLSSNPTTESLQNLEQQLLGNLDGRITALSDALQAEPVSLEDIPDSVYKRWVSEDFYKMEIYPKENLNDNVAMKRFVRQLQSVDNKVIGSPVISIEAGEAVITAFKSAFSYALIAITLLLFLLIKTKTDSFIILISLLTGAVFTCGFMLLFSIPLNFANIISLPLLFGIGVDSGIHIADRFRQEKDKNIFMTSSSRGVIVSSLTTICSIGSLAFSAHTGTASMGLLLTVGLASMMLATMLILPAFLVWQESRTTATTD